MIKYMEYNDLYKDKVREHIVSIAVREMGLEEFEEIFNSIEPTKYQEELGNFWIAIDETDKVIGTIGLKRSSEDAMKLIGVYVRKEYRGCGISKTLLDTAIGHCEEVGCREITLGTYERMERAILFYKKNGFIEFEPDYKSRDDERYFYYNLKEA